MKVLPFVGLWQCDSGRTCDHRNKIFLFFPCNVFSVSVLSSLWRPNHWKGTFQITASSSIYGVWWRHRHSSTSSLLSLCATQWCWWCRYVQLGHGTARGVLYPVQVLWESHYVVILWHLDWIAVLSWWCNVLMWLSPLQVLLTHWLRHRLNQTSG